jgi:outer membrane lipoprotein-sorting protein
MNTKTLLVAFAIVAAGFGLSAVASALAQNMTGGNNMTMTMNGNMTSMGGNMTQPLEDENMTAGG